jgi:hypothetical protein
MKKKLFFALVFPLMLTAENNTTAAEHNTTGKKTTKERNASTRNDKDAIEEKIRKQMEKEEKYAKEQKFYQADQYDFKGAEVDPESLKKIKPIEPDYDFDITDVYRDDI